MRSSMPPGQKEIQEFPRFGLPTFAFRLPSEHVQNFEIRGDVEHPVCVTKQMLSALPRVDQFSDFHCVTTWSVRNQHWEGVRFADFYNHLVATKARPLQNARLVVLRGCDGYVASLPLDDLLAPDVLLADRLGGESLNDAHGAPLRLVAPAHYGYKNVKHIVAIEFWLDRRGYRFPMPYPSLMEHPRARVALEERGRILAPRIFRFLYRPLIWPTRRLFSTALRFGRNHTK